MTSLALLAALLATPSPAAPSPAAPALPTWTLARWLDDGPVRTHCLDDGSLVVEQHGRLRRLTPDGQDVRLDGLGVVGELRRLPDGWWLQRRGTTDSAEGQRLDPGLTPVGAPFRVPAPAFRMAPCGPDHVIGRADARRAPGPLTLWDRAGRVQGRVPAESAPWGPLACDAAGETIYAVEAGDLVARVIADGAPRWRSPLGMPADGRPPFAIRAEASHLMVALGNGRLLRLDRSDGRRLAFSATTDATAAPMLRADGWWSGRHRLDRDTLDITGRAAAPVCPLPDGRARMLRADGTVISGPLEPLLGPRPGRGHAQTPSGIARHIGGAVYSIDEDRRVIAWDDGGRPRWVFEGLAATLGRDRDLALSRDGRWLFALGAATLQRLRTTDGAPSGRWALDGARAAGRLRMDRERTRAAFVDGAGRASRAHETPLAADGDALYMGLLDGGVLRIPWDGTTPHRFTPRSAKDAEGTTWTPGEASIIRVAADGIHAAMAHGMVQYWQSPEKGSSKPPGKTLQKAPSKAYKAPIESSGEASKAASSPLTPKLPGSPGIIAPLGADWLFGAWDSLVAFGPDGAPRPVPDIGGAAGTVRRMITDGPSAAIVWQAPDRRQHLRRITHGEKASPPLVADAIGPVWFAPDGLFALHRSADPETDAVEGDVEPVWQLAHLTPGSAPSWRPIPDADVELLPVHDESPALRLPDGRVVVGLFGGIAVLEGGRWQAGFWLGPARTGPTALAAHPSRPWIAVGESDGGVHVFDLTRGVRILHAFGYADGDWVVRRAAGQQAPPGGRHAPPGG